MAKGETFAPPSLKLEALNCVENLLIRDEICIEKYELITKLLDLLGLEDSLDLGEGIKLQLIDNSK